MIEWLMAFTFGDRVVLLDTEHNREGGVVGDTGEVRGISYEDDDPDTHHGYAVMVDRVGRTYFVLPDGLDLERDE